MTPDLIDGLSITLIVTIAACALCPLLVWILPNRADELNHTGQI